MKIIIVGGVAGGASAAARARRLSESAEIILVERGEYISFANCGLPYHIGNLIENRGSLLLITPEKFRARTQIDVRTLQEVTAIDRAGKRVTLQDLRSGRSYEESYDKLILSTGSSPIRPPIPGADDPDVFQLWTIPDMDRIVARIQQGARRAVVIGAGFIGLEVAENLRHRGLEVALVELLPQVLSTLDREMTQPLNSELSRHGISLHLGRKVVEIRRQSGDLHVQLDDSSAVATDFVVLSVGVRPNSELAAAAGLTLTPRNGIQVNEKMETSDSAIYAVGDVAAARDLVFGEPALFPLAGPANRQGRIAAENELELAYAPPFGSAKDPVNFAGMVAANALCGDTTPVQCDAVPGDALLLDVREPAEVEAGSLPGSQAIPLGQLRGRLNELPKDKRIVAFCRVGLRGYLAERILKENGFNAANLSGGLLTWKLFNPED